MNLEGRNFGEFEIVECLGQGGMGTVYKARQISLNRFVAVKTLHPSLSSDAEYSARFRREASAAAVLNHPNLVQVYAAGESEGVHWFAMEYIEGVSGRKRLQRKGRLKPQEAVAIGLHVATALNYAWRKASLIHRDIKPDNIFLSRDGQVKLGDLGLAKSLGQVEEQGITGASMGTPHYMSPEQAEAKKDTDFRTDIYSLGCTLFHLLSGQLPYVDDSAVVVMIKHVSAPVPDLRSVWPECPVELATAVQKMMQKQPADRQQTYEEVIADLWKVCDVLSGAPAPTVAAAPARPETKPRPIAVVKKSAVPVAAWIGGGCALLAALGALLYLAPWKKEHPKPGGTRSVVSQKSADQEGKKTAAADAARSKEATPAAVIATLTAAASPQPQLQSTPAARTTPAATPQPSTAAKPAPSPTPKALTETEKWLAQVDGPQQEKFQKEVLKPFSAGIANLRAQHLAALNAANAKASAAGQLEEALMWRTEKQAFEKVQSVAVDTADTPAALKKVRAGFREQLARLNQDRSTHAAALFDPFDAILAKYQTLLTQRQQLDDALLLKTRREELAFAWLRPPPMWTDVLAAVDLEAAKEVAGSTNTWERTPAGIAFKESTKKPPYMSAFEVPVALGSFAIEMEFTCSSAPEHVGISVPLFGEASVSGWTYPRNGYAGIAHVDGKDPGVDSPPGVAAPFPKIRAHQRYKMRIEVRRAPEGVDIQFAVDDALIGTYRGPTNRLKLSSAWIIRNDRKSAWIGTNAPTVFHTVRVASLDDITTLKEAAPLAGGAAANTPSPTVPVPRVAAPSMSTAAGAALLATKEQPFVNSLGMKFVPVPITGGPTSGKRVLFSVWDTRVQDYGEYAQTKGITPEKAPFDQTPTHPVVEVSWLEAGAFCVWLTERERAAGRISTLEEYRLPSDHEWSCAAGIGAREIPTKLPIEKDGKIANVFSWGSQWPPPKGTGNYGPSLQVDEFKNTSPVGSFKTNQFGLYDMGGNVYQWCEDWFDKEKKDHVLRGPSWNDYDRGNLPLSHRLHNLPDNRIYDHGFRCVLAPVSTPVPSPNLPLQNISSTPAGSIKDGPFVNSLGMKFVPVPIVGGPSNSKRVLFSIWDSRVQDYAAFAQETARYWPKPDITQGPTHPAVNVTWDDAKAFCLWLTARERAAGIIGRQDEYQLPTDHEWSCAVEIGLRESADANPESKSGKIANAYPWGTNWPPLEKAGNYAGEELQSAVANGKYKYIPEVLASYRDEFVETAPVGSFSPNQLGLYDMGGNVWQWCEDWYNSGQKDKVLRGASWIDRAAGLMVSSYRAPNSPTVCSTYYGFRCILRVATSNDAKLAQAASVPPTPSKDAASKPPTSATKESPFVNTLGMKFVPVPIVGGPTRGQLVLFSIWDTRVQDYAVFATETKREWPKPEIEQGPTHPAVMVSWEDATAFCAWLTERERKAGKIGANEAYRLPSDHEWSRAVGLPLEKGATPAEQSGKNQVDFPWGIVFPPKKIVGNYADTSYHAAFPARQCLEGYTDGFATTSPVGSFPANRFGLYDMGGNVWQWCEDWVDQDQKNRVLRGAPWVNYERSMLLSSCRYSFVPGPGGRYSIHGFRCVLGVSGGKDSNLAQVASVPPSPSKDATSKQLASATKESPFVNSLGMKFAPVPITGGPTEGRHILFSVWDTRVQDYEIFANETRHGWAKPDFVQAPAHPAVGLSWDDAQLFCQWLTAREQAAGRLPADWKYRLPSDHEWSCAVGIAPREKATMLPAEKNGKITDAFPWGFQWPPPLGAGNYSGSLGVDKYPNTSPVGSFSPNRFGLRDLGGNVWQWCEDFYIDQDQKDRVLRGCSWYHNEREQLLSSYRGKASPSHYAHDVGFRCVVDAASP